jgi:hypothetical protein
VHRVSTARSPAARTVAVAGRDYRFDVPVVAKPAGLHVAEAVVGGAAVTVVGSS